MDTATQADVTPPTPTTTPEVAAAAAELEADDAASDSTSSGHDASDLDSSGSAGVAPPPEMLSVAEHLRHMLNLLGEADDFEYESAWYHLFDWILSYHANKSSKPGTGTDAYRISWWPQARLPFQGPPPNIVSDQGEVSEYVPEEPVTAPPKPLGSAITSGLRMSSRLKELRESETSEDPVRRRQPARSCRSKKNDKPVEPKDPEDAKARFPDFLLAIYLYGQPKIIGIHSLVENKRLYTRSHISQSSPDEKAADIATAFESLQAQIVEATTCAFQRYRNNQTITYLSTVGYYFRVYIFNRNSMLPDDFDWNRPTTLLDAEVRRCVKRNTAGDVYHLLNYPDNTDYSTQFYLYWDKALANTLGEMRKKVSDSTVVVRDSTNPAVEDHTARINEILIERAKAAPAQGTRAKTRRRDARAGPSRTR